MARRSSNESTRITGSQTRVLLDGEQGVMALHILIYSSVLKNSSSIIFSFVSEYMFSSAQ